LSEYGPLSSHYQPLCTNPQCCAVYDSLLIMFHCFTSKS